MSTNAECHHVIDCRIISKPRSSIGVFTINVGEDENTGNMQVYGQGHNCQVTIGVHGSLYTKLPAIQRTIQSDLYSPVIGKEYP
jgi:hypothetical protein